MISRKNFNVTDKFEDWLMERLAERGWSIRELARRCGLSDAHISNTKNGNRTVTWDTVATIAEAFGETPETAFRLVGLLPKNKMPEKRLQEILNYMPEDIIEDVLKYAEWKRGGNGHS